MTNRPSFIEHQALARLLPHWRNYLHKGLLEIKPNGGKFRATEEESYAANVFERVGELDSSVKSLRLAMGFILDLKNTHEDAPEIYRYHYENFLLRLIGIVDRADRLVGASLQLNPSKLKNNGANKFVAKNIASDYPEVHECLKRLGNATAQHKILRDEVAHSQTFSTRELGMFSAVNLLKLEVGDMSKINELMDDYFSTGGAELALLVGEMVTGIEALLDALAPIYKHRFAENTYPFHRG